jgi:hypothetical protein
MQSDMHYYGTYAMARAAGIRADTCRVIATAAQFVDDHANREEIVFRDGARIDTEATAHHAQDLHNLMLADQRLIWVPFHFLPGNEGESYDERMVCRKDSDIAKAMVEHNLSCCEHPFAPELLGITAHVYADTFSHHGFSGFSSELNKVDQNRIGFSDDLGDRMRHYITDKAQRFFHPQLSWKERFLRWRDQLLGQVADDLSRLGHGGVATYPDRPYLKWSFTYEATGQRVERNNPADFLDGARALHDMFSRFAAMAPAYADAAAARPFAEIEASVREVIAVQAEKAGRIKAWQLLAGSGKIFASGGESIPVYNAGDWHTQRQSLSRLKHSGEAIATPIYRFYQAASVHRNHVLRELLPAHDLVAH